MNNQLQLLEVVSKVGISIFLSVGMFVLLCWVVKHILVKMTAGLDKVCTQLDKHDHETDIRSQFVRKEHEQMIETLGRINGYRKE